MNSSGPQLSIKISLNPAEIYSDSRKLGYQGSSRNVRLGRVTPPGGGSIAKSEDGIRCVVTGKESLRILRISEPSQAHNPEHKSAVGRGGHRIDASRNFWEGSGLKIDSVSTDVAWGHGLFNNKILTSARNGDLILWDLNKSGVTKYERRTKDHIRSIHKMSVSHVVHPYCITGSADGHMRVWDIRDLSKSIMRVHHPTSVRSLVFSPSLWQPLQAMVGLDNGSIYRWDLKMGQRGQLDKLPVAHTASVTTLDWCSAGAASSQGTSDAGSTGLGWLVSGGLDRCVKVWDLTSPSSSSHIPNKPTYTLHPSFAVRRLAWRPGYECEIAVVSNTEYATPSVDLGQTFPSNVSPGLLTRVGSGLGLDSLLRGPNPTESLYSVKEKPSEKNSPPITCLGDAVEIWDVRRGWIAKWSVTGSAAEGGVTDIAFGDSQGLWAQHASGSFSQFDLRGTVKPIDAIPRVATTWEVGGSMAFVVDNQNCWEIPYDDISPAVNHSEMLKPHIKTLGDPTARIATQTLGTYTHDFSGSDQEIFTDLARKYIFEGHDRKEICLVNAKVALEAGHESAAQVWLLLGAALTHFLPNHPPTSTHSPSSRPKDLQTSPHPQAPMSPYSFPPSFPKVGEMSPSIGRNIITPRRSTSGSLPRMSMPTPPSATRRLTPASSASSSPRHLPVSLPPVTPRRASFFGRRDSMDIIAPEYALARRPSLASSVALSASSPSDRNTPSHRHVGEGVLDDSESSGSGETDEDDEETAGANSSDDVAPLVSPALALLRAVPTPSPLSRVASHQTWTEDEDDGERDDTYSPSPQSSSDSDSRGSSSPNKRTPSAKSRRRGLNHFKTRSRSSTVASLAAPHVQPRPLIHQDSQSSIRTVTVTETPLRDQSGSATINSPVIPPYLHQDRVVHTRQKSQVASEFAFNAKTAPPLPDHPDTDDPADENHLTERCMDLIRLEDTRFRATTLSALEVALEDFAEEGDVQMCAMLALVAPVELHISSFRATRFLDSYIDLLTRLRLHVCAAYLRKHCEIEEIRKTTLLETTIYTSCGKCRKPLLLPAGTFSGRAINRGGFSYCLGCKVSVVKCSICRLPVRALLFQCSVCNHGGHQACYRQYYMEQPMVDYPTSFLPPNNDSRGRMPTRMPPSTVDDDSSSTASMQSSNVDSLAPQSPAPTHRAPTLAAHPCAAGCGHFCWAANRVSE